MTPQAKNYFDKLITQYVEAGYPHRKSWAFSPDTDEEQHTFNELRARGLISQFTMEMWVLTEAGLSAVLQKTTPSREANALFQNLKRQYIEAGYPQRLGWAFEPDDDSQEAAYNELRARGYIDQRTMTMYVLSEAGLSKVMEADLHPRG